MMRRLDLELLVDLADYQRIVGFFIKTYPQKVRG
jgi:hypothetical protein